MTHQLTLQATAFNKGQLIQQEAPQIALAGRSNVGKSSLINALAGRKQLAKTSATPGKTRSINYYKIDGAEAFLVDLPGYGYARCGQEERNKWAELLEYYLANTQGLAGMALLVDARHLPQQIDIDLAKYAISLGLPLLPVLTKADKCNKKTLNATVCAWKRLLPQAELIITSAEKKDGINIVWQAIIAQLHAVEQVALARQKETVENDTSPQQNMEDIPSANE